MTTTPSFSRVQTFVCSRNELTGGADEVAGAVMDAVRHPVRTGWSAIAGPGSLKRSDLWIDESHLIVHRLAKDAESAQPGATCEGRQAAAGFLAKSLVRGAAAAAAPMARPPWGSISGLIEQIVDGSSGLSDGATAGVLVGSDSDGRPSLHLIAMNDHGTLWWGRSTDATSEVELRPHDLAGFWSTLLEWLEPLSSRRSAE